MVSAQKKNQMPRL